MAAPPRDRWQKSHLVLVVNGRLETRVLMVHGNEYIGRQRLTAAGHRPYLGDGRSHARFDLVLRSAQPLSQASKISDPDHQETLALSPSVQMRFATSPYRILNDGPFPLPWKPACIAVQRSKRLLTTQLSHHEKRHA